LDGRSKKNIVSNTGPNTPNILPGRDQFNIGPNTPSILPGRCPLNESISTVPSVRNVSVKNGSAQPIEQQDYSGTIRSCTARNAVLKKCEGKASKLSCAFCQSDDITEVCTHTRQVGLQKSLFLKVTNSSFN
jgi:BRCA1-associated RING domain protein 1